MRSIQAKIDSGELEPLSVENVEMEAIGLYEDLLNWDCGHTMEPGLAPVMTTAETE